MAESQGALVHGWETKVRGEGCHGGKQRRLPGGAVFRSAEPLFLAPTEKISKTPPMKLFRLPQKHSLSLASLFLFFPFSLRAATPSAHWPQFRGPDSLGVSE